MPPREHAVCVCCHQKFLRANRTNMYTSSDAASVTAPRSDLCDECRRHQGNSVEQQLHRYRDHELILGERLYAADQYARKAAQEKKDAREQAASALRSRDRMAQWLKQVQDLHTLRPNGACTCGKAKGCATAELLVGDRWLSQRLSRVALPDEGEHDWERRTERLTRREPWMDGRAEPGKPSTRGTA
ncbi:hypothetical protein [Nocardioides sp.]|uniref:hypothetical protein n=1 Tax=Nocardioides sp. TaxID=35761 RepID=UPI002732C29E|nr:hypothetical protein [Nocardioides sp.]MDP3890502.1 hypothetical protein [Nocardioides sp.]